MDLLIQQKPLFRPGQPTKLAARGVAGVAAPWPTLPRRAHTTHRALSALPTSATTRRPRRETRWPTFRMADSGVSLQSHRLVRAGLGRARPGHPSTPVEGYCWGNSGSSRGRCRPGLRPRAPLAQTLNLEKGPLGFQGFVPGSAPPRPARLSGLQTEKCRPEEREQGERVRGAGWPAEVGVGRGGGSENRRAVRATVRASCWWPCSLGFQTTRRALKKSGRGYMPRVTKALPW